VQVRGVKRDDGSFLHVLAIDDDVMMSGAFFEFRGGWDNLVAFDAEFCGEWRRHRRVVLLERRQRRQRRKEVSTVLLLLFLKERAKEKERNFISQTINTFGSIQYTPFLLLLFSDNACASIGWPRESTTEATAAAVDNANWRLLIVFSSSLLFFFPSSSSKRKFIIARETVVVVLFLLCLLNETVVVLVLLRAAVVVDAVIKLISFLFIIVYLYARELVCCVVIQNN
jgi:hypothetical protein